ncbi:methyltransferase FkbM domain containing protein [Nitzschia inconspicua]|uniref:Methyltransferase FkbM domain containing protein n=1 Tax=Nitzschia inconspicua TaxID=303405 RepID=A0A9K3PRU0_9STRA|nr:methyltransferase FkbM domain containing protein [Nitzschia inconspicua]
MAVIRRPGGGNSASSGGIVSLPLFLGLFLGGLSMYYYLDGGAHPAPSGLLELDRAAGLTSTATSNSDGSIDAIAAQADGWHPIHVYYGDRSGLGASPTQESFAQVKQDLILLDLIGPNGYFIDLAANDAKDLTNTLVLERHGWKGLCVEPNPIYWYGLSHRKCTVVGALVGGTKQKVQVKFRGVYGGILGNMDQKLANRKKEPDAATEDRYTAPIMEVLKIYRVPQTIDYMSLDVEGSEYEIMKDFPFEEYKIKILTVERPSNALKDLLLSKGYIELKTLAWWGEYLWCHKSTGFTPDHPKIKKIVTEERN